MKLDDRPVIDQLLNPTPLNILDEVMGIATDHIADGYDKAQSEIDAHVFKLLELVPEGQERDYAWDLIRVVAEALHSDDQRRQDDLLGLVHAELEARL